MNWIDLNIFCSDNLNLPCAQFHFHKRSYLVHTDVPNVSLWRLISCSFSPHLLLNSEVVNQVNLRSNAFRRLIQNSCSCIWSVQQNQSKGIHSKYVYVLHGLPWVLALLGLVGCTATSQSNDAGGRLEPVQGESVTITFHEIFPHINESSDVPTYSLFRLSQSCLLARNDRVLIRSIMRCQNDYEQYNRYSLTSSDHFLTVNLTIQNISVGDSDVYVLNAKMVRIFNGTHMTIIYEKNSTQTVSVRVPPGDPNCSLTGKWHYQHDQELRVLVCRALSNGTKSSISCFQEERKSLPNGDVLHNKTTVMGTFLVRPSFPVYCCSHFSDQDLSQDMCKSLRWDLSSMLTSKPEMPGDEQNTSTGIDEISDLVPIRSAAQTPQMIPSLSYCSIPLLSFYVFSDDNCVAW